MHCVMRDTDRKIPNKVGGAKRWYYYVYKVDKTTVFRQNNNLCCFQLSSRHFLFVRVKDCSSWIKKPMSIRKLCMNTWRRWKEMMTVDE